AVQAALEDVAAVARIPDEGVVAGSEEPGVGAPVAVDRVVAAAPRRGLPALVSSPPPPVSVSAPLPPLIVSLSAPPSIPSLISAASPTAPEIVSLPASPL